MLNNKKIRKEYDKLKYQFITAPFENKIASEFKKRSWIVWANAIGDVIYNNKRIATIPKEVGEIDILAISPDYKYVVIADCKYLFDYGAVAREIKNLNDRLENKYIPQIKRKQNWLRDQLNSILETVKIESDNTLIKPMIITRNRIPLDLKDEIEILPVVDLIRWLDQLD